MNEHDWIALLRERMPPLYRSVSRRVGGQRDLAEDITQEAWLRAVQAWREQGLPRDPGAWLRTVANNLIRNHFRRLRHHDPLDAQDVAQDPPEERASQRAALLQQGLARLRPGVAELLGERYFDGHSLEEMARRRGWSKRAVEGRLRRGRAQLARHLDAQLLDEALQG